jgi:hypothetical protein
VFLLTVARLFAHIHRSHHYRVKKDAYLSFEDNAQFLLDVTHAIANGSTACAYPRFKQACIEARHILIVTARGQHPDVLRAGMKKLIESLSGEERAIMQGNIMTNFGPQGKLATSLPETVHAVEDLDTYLDHIVQCFPVNNPEFRTGFDLVGQGIEHCKQVALSVSIERSAKLFRKSPKSHERFSFAFGFSDDDARNISTILALFKTLTPQYPDVKFVVYDTSDSNKPLKHEVDVGGSTVTPIRF